MMTTTNTMVNGIDVAGLKQLIDTVAADPTQGHTRFGVTTRWAGGTVSNTHVTGWTIGGKHSPKDYTITIDEPLELGGTNTQPNPQEYLMAALNACMMVGYVAIAAMQGIELEMLEIQCEGEIDLRGFLGIDPTVKPGYDTIHYNVRIKGDATAEQFEQLHQMVMATSPNRFNIANPIRLTSQLVVA